ncbi:hypothetical protein [Roseovarius sp. MMSF_3281]|uniref:hypothetical protein n=1 Tax=Roseovarius sp. MMSF_3281 TaxID=3046694 RepID=UPI00273F3859|nr:hypothetical protein [Roseovarius sp. MMSF_3281]
MTVTRILDGLEAMPATGAEADTAARLGFLEWAFAMPGDATPQAARDALRTEAAQEARSPAARAFVGFLQAACVPVGAGRGRVARRARVLH